MCPAALTGKVKGLGGDINRTMSVGRSDCYLGAKGGGRVVSELVI